MSFVGSGNTQDKTGWFTICQRCGKKGMKRRGLVNRLTKTLIISERCKYCGFEKSYKEIRKC